MEKRKYKRNRKKKYKDKCEQDLEHINWMEILKVNDQNVDTSLRHFLQILSSPLEKHVPLRRKMEIKTKSKPWITPGILALIRNKNKIYSKFCKAKDQEQKDLLHQQFNFKFDKKE